MDRLDHLIDDEGHQVKSCTIIGSGLSAVVVHRDDKAIKMAIVHTNDQEDEVESNRGQIRREQRVYRRLQPDHAKPIPGIVPCLGMPGDTIELQFMSNGTLGEWIKHRDVPSFGLQSRWIRQLAVGLSNFHASRVIHSDILLRNILIDGSLNAMLADFGASTVLPLDSVMVDTVDQYNCSMWTDLFQLGLVFYSIVTGKQAGKSIYHGKSAIASLPPRNTLPSVAGLWASQIIEECWTPGAYGAAGAAGIFAKLDNMEAVANTCLPRCL
jgi:serine/threonine protein kinase